MKTLKVWRPLWSSLRASLHSQLNFVGDTPNARRK